MVSVNYSLVTILSTSVQDLPDDILFDIRMVQMRYLLINVRSTLSLTITSYISLVQPFSVFPTLQVLGTLTLVSSLIPKIERVRFVTLFGGVGGKVMILNIHLNFRTINKVSISLLVLTP